MPSVISNNVQFISSMTIFSPQGHLLNPIATLSPPQEMPQLQVYSYTLQPLEVMRNLLSSLLKSLKVSSLDKCYFQWAAMNST